MKLRDILGKNGILINFKPADKAEALSQLGRYIASLHNLTQPDVIVRKILEREAEMSTGIGYGVALPHARIDGLDRLYLMAARVAGGIEFDAIDEQPVSLIFMMLSPTNTSSDHTHILSSISRIMSYEEIRRNLLAAQDAEAFRDIVVTGEDRYVE